MPYTISQLVARIRDVVEGDPYLKDVRVEGEVSNFSQAGSGHCYFTLKDAEAELRCVMWRGVAISLRALPKNGDQVLAHGYVGIYEQRGSLQFYVEYLEPAGVGLLYQQFEQRKAHLEAEGLFDAERKRPLPRFPQQIGIVTSPTAAALQDILNVLNRRYPLAQVILSPTLVQGEEAPSQIVAALEALNKQADVDVILVARGGGSLEDLWAFNDEGVARAVAASRIPVVCGVGHETDFSLADFAADQRAPTPSAAAEVATPDQVELRAHLAIQETQLATLITAQLAQQGQMLAEQKRALRHLSPITQLVQARQRVDDWSGQAADTLRHNLALHRERLAGLTGRLEGVNPLATLERGYAVIHRPEDQKVIHSISQVSPGENLDVRVSDGEFGVTVQEKP